MTEEHLTQDQIAAAQLADWRFISQALQTRFVTGDFATGLRLVDAIGEAAEAAGHHPDLDLRYPHVNVKVWTHEASGVTGLDVSLARKISEIAAGLGIAADPTAVSG
ncbi:MAG: 4a-hydroxytetrahydrobiopterin dehydratase [Propionicimonas sp.]